MFLFAIKNCHIPILSFCITFTNTTGCTWYKDVYYTLRIYITCMYYMSTLVTHRLYTRQCYCFMKYLSRVLTPEFAAFALQAWWVQGCGHVSPHLGLSTLDTTIHTLSASLSK